jgi:hypothetical protein
MRFIFRQASDLLNPAELLQFLARFPEHAEQQSASYGALPTSDAGRALSAIWRTDRPSVDCSDLGDRICLIAALELYSTMRTMKRFAR